MVAQDVADDLQVCSRINLPAGMCVPERMRTNHLRRDSCPFCILSDPMPDTAAGQRIVRYHCAQEDPARHNKARAFILQIGGQNLCNRRQQWQFKTHTGFWPPQCYDP